MSDRKPLCIHTLMSNGSHRRTRRCLFNFKKMDKEGILKAMTEDSFIPYCWTNPSLMVQHWHEWLEPKLDFFVPRKTAHRSSLPLDYSNHFQRHQEAQNRRNPSWKKRNNWKVETQTCAAENWCGAHVISGSMNIKTIFLLDVLQRKSSNIWSESKGHLFYRLSWN